MGTPTRIQSINCIRRGDYRLRSAIAASASSASDAGSGISAPIAGLDGSICPKLAARVLKSSVSICPSKLKSPDDQVPLDPNPAVNELKSTVSTEPSRFASPEYVYLRRIEVPSIG